MTEGTKFDTQKNRLDLIPAEVMEALGKVLTHGSRKYGDNNWQQGIEYRRVYGAIQRHLNAWRKGERVDEESGMMHLWNAFTELAFLIYYEQYPDTYKNFNTFLTEWNRHGKNIQ